MTCQLCERLTFDKLFRISDPKRVYRSYTVHGPPLEMDSYQDSVYYCFNFKSSPSTTGLRHRGYIKFFKPLRKNPKDVPLQHLECLVDCMCPDFKFRWAWANKQRGSSTVGPKSLNQAINRAPRKTNPTGKPGLCKHILAARQYIYGLIDAFDSDEPDTAEKLNKLTKIATKRWTDFHGAMAAAREKERMYNARRSARNVGMITPLPAEPLTPVRPATAPIKPAKPAQKPKAPGQPPEQTKSEPLPSAETEPLEPKGTAPVQVGSATPSTYTKPKPAGSKRVLGNRVVSGMIPGQKPGTWESAYNVKLNDVVMVINETSMSTLTEAIQLVKEMEDDELEARASAAEDDTLSDPDIGGSVEDDDFDLSSPPPTNPTEPPISDAAVGADTEGETALSLLRQMRDSLTQIVTAIAPASAEGVEPGTEGELPGEGEGEAEEAETADEEAAEGEDSMPNTQPLDKVEDEDKD